MKKKNKKILRLNNELKTVKTKLKKEVAKRKRAEEEAQRRATQAELIYDVGNRVSSELELDELFSAIVTGIYDAFGYYSVALALVDEKAGSVKIEAVAGGYVDQLPKGGQVSIGEGMTGYAVESGETQLSGDVRQDPHFKRLTDEATRSELSVPIKSGRKIIGVLDLQSDEFHAFDETDVMLIETLADQVAVAIENARLYEQAQKEIGERLQAEAALLKYQERLEETVEERTSEFKKSEARYRGLFDGIPIGLYRTTPAGQILDANPALVEMYGYTSRDALLETSIINAYVDPDERLRWQNLMETEGVVRDFEARIRRFDGSIIWVNDTARAVKDDRGQVLYYEGSIENITERKQAEAELRQYQEHLEELIDERTSELRESEEKYRTLFDGVPVGLYRTTPGGEVLDTNLAAAQMLGYSSREEALEKVNTAEVYIDPEERARWQELMKMEGVVRDFEEQIRRYDGEIIWLNDTARAVKDEHGQILYYEGSLEDITGRKQIELELRRQKEYYEALFLNTPTAVVTVDLDAKVVSWNPKAEELFGFSPEEAIDRNIDDLVANDPSVINEALQYTDQILNMERVQATTQRTRKDGSLIDVELLALPLILAGESGGFVAIYHDISDLKRIERELRQQKDYFESLFVNSPVAILTADLQAIVVSWNPKAEELFGYTKEEAIGRHVDDLVGIDERIHQEALACTRKLLTTDRLQARVKRNRKDGSLVDVEVLVLPAIIAGEKVGYIAIYYDISELLQARREAEAANQAKSVFLANMSHELRTPLNAILGFTQLMDGDANLTPGQQENLKIINQSGEHLLALINDVLAMSKIEAGRVELRKTRFDLFYLLESLEEMFHLKANAKGLDLNFHVDEAVPHYVITDEGKLRQVLSNLIGNAIKFTQDGYVSLNVSALPKDPGNNELRFDVLDSGPGIPPEDLEAVFDPFIQAGSDLIATQTPEGTGLGLAISRQYVQLMGGDIQVKSELGQGSIFSFVIIAEIAETGETLPSQPKQEVSRLAPDQPGYRILVVEDKESNRRLLVKLLEQLGFEAREAFNGQEAIDSFQGWEPHLIFMDMRMPVMDGLEATKRIKSLPGGKEVVIIALTATAFEEDREKILLDGCDDFVRKPFRKEEIYDLLIKHLHAEFVIKDTSTEPKPTEVSGAQTPSAAVRALAKMPLEWLEDLQKSTARADLFKILDLINQKRDQDPILADVLTDLAEKFHYQMIIDLIEESGGER